MNISNRHVIAEAMPTGRMILYVTNSSPTNDNTKNVDMTFRTHGVLLK